MSLEAQAIATAARRRTELAGNAMSHGIPKSLGGSRFSGEAEGRSLGLVSYSTSGHTGAKKPDFFEIDKDLARSHRLKKSIITGARLHEEEAQTGSFRGAWYMLTTTYRSGADASPRDISVLLKFLRRFFNRNYRAKHRRYGSSFRYLWVGELTKALKPHYHVLIWIPRGVYFPKVDQRGWWVHGHTQIQKARNAVGYLAKYASKFCPDVAAMYPKGFRTHGMGGLSTDSKRELRWWKSPKDAREALGEGADIFKTLGGYLDRLSGEFWPSPWRVFFDKGRTIAYRVQP